MRVIAEVSPATLIGPENPWLYFYEDFLAAYDPRLRRDAGAYYTPVQVVRAQVRLIDDLLAKDSMFLKRMVSSKKQQRIEAVKNEVTSRFEDTVRKDTD